MKKVMAIMMLIAAFAVNAHAQKPAVVVSNKPGWQKIGEITADLKVDKDAIAVLGKDKFKAIQLRVTDAPLQIYDLEVFFENGEKEDIQVRENLKAGGETKTLDLKGGTREIKKVAFIYKTVENANNDKAHVELYGMK